MRAYVFLVASLTATTSEEPVRQRQIKGVPSRTADGHNSLTSRNLPPGMELSVQTLIVNPGNQTPLSGGSKLALGEIMRYRLQRLAPVQCFERNAMQCDPIV